MCLVGVAFGMHADYPLILAGNRDEYHARPAAPAGWWEDQPAIAGGRDLQAGGTWLAASRDAHVAVVTNRPDLPPPDEGARSRGELVTGALSPDSCALAELEDTHHHYGGFSLLLANRECLTLISGGNGTGFMQISLAPGIYAISNTAIDQPWPKTLWLEQQLEQRLDETIAAEAPDAARLLELLAVREPVPGATSHGVPATPFVVGDSYGTRCSTVVMIGRDGSGSLREQRFGPGGLPAGESALEFAAG